MRIKRALLGVVCAGAMVLVAAAPAQAAPPEPEHVFTTFTPNSESLEDPCGVAIAASGTVHLANYYRRNIASFTPIPWPPSALVGLSALSMVITDALDPCDLELDSTGRLYVNNYHRNVERYSPAGAGFGPPTLVDSSHPTGVAVNVLTNDVYVNARTHITAYGPSGAPLMDGPEPLKIGVDSLGDGYGLAVSRFPATLGRIYAPDYSDDTVKVYDPLIDKADPVQTITGPPGGFGSLRDSAVAVDRVTGEVYVADTLAYPQYTERPEAVIYVFEPTGAYKGRLKYGVIDGSPPGLAVDNTAIASQGRVYLTSGNTIQASIYAYGPGSATSQSAPAAFSLSVKTEGEGSGSFTSSAGELECEQGSCEAELLALSETTLTVTPDPGSAFAGWSGAGCSGTGPCTVTMDQARSVSAEFSQISGPPADSTPAFRPSAASRSASATPSVIAQKGTLRVTVKGDLAPRRLPRRGTAPIAVTVGGQITTTDKTMPPQLKRIQIELNRGGKLDTQGLPPCSYGAIQPGSSDRALAACKDSLVGKGSFTADITLAGQEPYPTGGKMLLFHSVEKGKPVLYGHIYSPKPFATSFVIVFKVQKVSKGTYGIALNAPLPPAMDAWGRLTGLQMTLSRRYSHKGKAHSFISAGCPAPKGFSAASFPLARTEFSFDGGKRLASTLMSQCRVRG